jgi:transcriptional regulator PpsR
LSPLADELAATIACVASDVALVIDANGVIASVAESPSVTASACGAWLGQSWLDTATDGTRMKIQALLDEVSTSGMTRRREVNHPGRDGDDIPMTWAAIRLGERGPVLAVGRDLRTVAAIQQRFVEAQQDMERHYWRRRQAEARSEQLFHVASDGVLVLAASNLQVLEANDSAASLLGVEATLLQGRAFPESLPALSRPALIELLSSVRSSGQVSAIRLRLPAAIDVLEVSATPFRVGGQPRLLVRVRRDEGADPGADALSRMAQHVQQTPDAVAITDSSGAIQMANPAFVRLAHHTEEATLKGRALAEVLCDSDGAWSRLVMRACTMGIVPQVALTVALPGLSALAVKVTAFLLTDGEQARLGFVLRPHAQSPAPSGPADWSRELVAQVGHMPIDELLAEAVHRAERQFIEAALAQSGGQPEAAAQALGLTPEALALRMLRHRLSGDAGSLGGDASAPPNPV